MGENIVSLYRSKKQVPFILCRDRSKPKILNRFGSNLNYKYMKKIIWLSIILLSVNLLLFPKKARTGSLDRDSGIFSGGMSCIYLAPIWSKSYDSHIISFVPSNTQVWSSTDLAGNLKWPELAISFWVIYFFFPSYLIFCYSVFYDTNNHLLAI